jgi:hypothetical protein
MKTILIVTACACLAGCSASPPQAETDSTVIATAAGPAPTDKPRLQYEDDEMRIVAVDYGRSDSPQIPGLYVFGKRHQKWIRIDRVSLRHAVLGRNPTFEECRAAGVNPPSNNWDFRQLRGRDCVELPLMNSGFLFFPDRIEKNEQEGRLILRFGSQWQIPQAETVLVIALGDLRHALAAQ